MRIGINARFFRYPATGIGQYLRQLAAMLLVCDTRNSYHFLSPGVAELDSVAMRACLQEYRVPRWGQWHEHLEQVCWEQMTIQRAARQQRVDVLHHPYFAAPLFRSTRVPSVVTIPDMIQFRLPEYAGGLSKQLYLQTNIRGALHASAILTLSMHAKQDILDLLHFPEEKVHVIPIAAGDEYAPIEDTAVVREVCSRYGIKGRYVFYLGGFDRRKNILQLIRAFALLCERLPVHDAMQLFIAGDPVSLSGNSLLFPDPRPLARQLGIADRVVYGYVEECDKPALYSGAAVFVFPSLYEGFGLTPLEAMKCGAPVICSNRTALPEVVGDAAISLNPEDTGALTDAMYAVLCHDHWRSVLCARSLRQASRFSWQQTALETLAVYEEIYEQRQRRWVADSCNSI